MLGPYSKVRAFRKDCAVNVAPARSHGASGGPSADAGL